MHGINIFSCHMIQGFTQVLICAFLTGKNIKFFKGVIPYQQLFCSEPSLSLSLVAKTIFSLSIWTNTSNLRYLMYTRRILFRAIINNSHTESFKIKLVGVYNQYNEIEFSSSIKRKIMYKCAIFPDWSKNISVQYIC